MLESVIVRDDDDDQQEPQRQKTGHVEADEIENHARDRQFC